jgi:cell division protein FtsA
MKSIDLNKNLSERIKCNFEKICNGEVNLLIKSELENKKISLNIIKKIVDARIDETLDYIYKNITFCRALNTSARKIIITGGGADLKIFHKKIAEKLKTSVEYAKQSFPIKDTEFNIFSDYMVCLGIAKLIFYPNKDEIKSFTNEKKGFFNRFYSLFLK